MARILFGIASSNALSALLFSSVAAMVLIGLNVHQVADRRAERARGLAKRKATSEHTLVDPPTLTHVICKISADALADLFNGMIRAVAAI